MGGFVKRRYRTGVPMKVVDAPVSADQKDRFFAELSKQFEHSPKEAATKAGISRAAYDELVRTDREFAGRVARYRGDLLKQIEERALQLAITGDSGMIRFVLAAEMPEKYGRTAKSDLAHGIESPDDLKNLTDDELKALKAQLS